MKNNKPRSLPPRVRYSLREMPEPVRCPCGALLLKALSPAVLELKCRRCGKLLELETR